MDKLIYIIVALFATVAGSVSGMGGGIIMKPVFDLLGKYDAFQISVIMSGTMLAMSTVSVGTSAKNLKNEKENSRKILCIAIGSMLGGYFGEKNFSLLMRYADDITVKSVQNAVMLVLVIVIILYMRSSKKTLAVKSAASGLPIGLILGIISAFLGIGGGPVNVAVITFIFGFEIKTAVICSLASVMLSQGAKIFSIILSYGSEAFAVDILPLIVAAGVCGALIGRTISKKVSNKTANSIFIGIQLLVITLCLLNIIKLFQQLESLL